MNETTRQRGQIVLLRGSILGIGTFGYYFIETGWSISDAFYMTVITITTVGYQEVHPLSTAGRYFSVFVIFLSFGAVGLFAAQLAKIIIESEIRGVFARS